MKHTFTFIKTTRVLLPLFALVLLAATACNKKNDKQITGTAYVEVTNASQDSAPMDLYINSVKQNTLPLPYRQSTQYISLNAGVSIPGLLKVSSTGTNVSSFNLQLYPNTYYTLFQFGTFTAIYPDDLTIVAGKARVRFINLNIGLTDNLDFGVTGSPTPLITSLSQALNSPYISITPGSSISVYTTGSTTSLIDIPTTTEAGHVYTIFLSGTLKADLTATVLVQK